MKEKNVKKDTLCRDFYSILDDQNTCKKEIYDDLQSSIEAQGEIISRIKHRNHINDLDKMDLNNLETLNKHIEDMLKQFDEIVSKKG